ncbi:hypothetical protein CROQUDRAFT_44124 [Cronartium quercuum f. sp. fusiforme G11]|uniref:UspA domain-containing protein n=1 Tax=Cronartium quercuum f. sp. fusiforme G11 TaxID=708437 RepID=A0A9P6NMA3_9BASI|nr:hypothetical protein CROQUDRAFT_44124 [Cronartium quercuum f. sp. fusiforme G11]
MKSLFHKKVPSVTSFSFGSFRSNSRDPSEPRSPNHSQSDCDNNNSTKVNKPASAPPPITLVVCPDDPSQLQILEPSTAATSSRDRRGRSGSLVNDHSNQDGTAQEQRGRSISANGIRVDERPKSERSSSTNTFNSPRIRLSALFQPSHRHSSSASCTTTSAAWSKTDESDGEEIADVRPGTAFDQESDSDSETSGTDQSSNEDKDEEDESAIEENDRIRANTNANASALKPIDYLQQSSQPIPFIDQAPNLTAPPLPPAFVSADLPRVNQKKKHSIISNKTPSLRRKKSQHQSPAAQLPLTVSRPIYEKNRCTITIEHGDRAAALATAERTRFYLVASDMSEESKYAIEWTIGTVLRQGDECLILNVIETETKLDPEEGGSGGDPMAKIRNQKDRQEKATLLVREATALLERTRLNVKVTCQALHAKNSKHMLIDSIDFLKPHLVIVGSRGLSAIKGSIMGSVSHYLVQKSSVPVMVARRKLRPPPKVYKHKSELDRQPRMRLDQAEIDKESHNSQVAHVSPSIEKSTRTPSLDLASESKNKGKQSAGGRF